MHKFRERLALIIAPWLTPPPAMPVITWTVSTSGNGVINLPKSGTVCS